MDDDAFLVALREYIERVEVMIDGTVGACRTVDELVADGQMPTVYAEVLRRLGVV